MRFVYVAFVLLQSLFATGIIIDLPNGKVEGLTDVTRAGTKFSSFLAMRYAQPPVGHLRFELPQPVKNWTGIYNATAEKNICHQMSRRSNLENEDCLFINVFTPKDLNLKNMSSNLSVMVFIHGGGFISGSGSKSAFGPNFFMDYNVILVSFNYRLGPFGFLSTGDNVLPGNLGLKDQVAALQWVQANIAYFGGDRGKVTIFGQSSGAGSVGLLLMSPLSTGLYSGAIMESGSGLLPQAYQRNETNITYATAARLNSSFRTNRNSSDLLQFLKNVSEDSLASAASELTTLWGTSANIQISKGFFYAPVIEVEHPGAFLTKRMYSVIEGGHFNKVPTMMGFNSDEALALLGQPGYLDSLLHDYNAHPEFLVPFDMHITNKTTIEHVGKLIKNFYTHGEGFQNHSLYGVNFHSGHDLEKPILKHAELQAQHSPVYFYEFSYSGPMGNNANRRLPGSSNVSHGEELNYIFSRRYNEEIPDNTDLSVFPENDRKVHERMMTLWTNFAKYRNPTPHYDPLLQNLKWSVIYNKDFKYLEIGRNLKVKSGYPKAEGYNFWNRLFCSYALKPFDTY